MNHRFLINIIHFVFLLLLTAPVQLAAQSETDYTALIKQQKAIEARKQAAVPKENIAKHVQSITTSSAIITALATMNKQLAFKKADAILKQ